MAGVNKVILIGHLGRDPELRTTQGGTDVCRLSLATTRKWLNKQSNEKMEETEWHRVTVWGKQAGHCNQYLAKGREVYVEGRLRTSSYDDKDGVKRYSTEIIAVIVQFLGGRVETNDHKDAARQPAPQPAGQPPPNDFLPPAPEDDDIPF